MAFESLVVSPPFPTKEEEEAVAAEEEAVAAEAAAEAAVEEAADEAEVSSGCTADAPPMWPVLPSLPPTPRTTKRRDDSPKRTCEPWGATNGYG
eukprot:CAMPEP_0119488022 /NCGR_PEP_ID=MMETSP1344-20130328/13931_1 /TAXON_ID=236787 /ORGANISM="Florenciella parvula, Strain CCMP2471" /LENGTH=93 /DNA_ID=CAMNT_0007522937 /DNA_START=332 /DNA_END=613 /DNA_ORIENTATION=+